MRTAFLLGVALASALAACRTETTTHAPGPASVSITQAIPKRAWELWTAGRCLGAVVRFEAHDDSGRFYYSVRNPEGQEMGIVDLNGRAFRYRAHSIDPEWIGTGPVFDGARRILDAEAAPDVVEVDVTRLQEILAKEAASHP
jgi:hypothetical protein